MDDKKTVVVGMSGGVDSSVVALLLKQQGYEVIGLHMNNGNKKDQEDVKNICNKLGIKYYIEDYKDEMQYVKDYFINEYASGRTPNPCVVCNKEVKFKPFIEFAERIGADYFATGHYANVKNVDGVVYLLRGKDESKDQTYFLNQLSQNQLKKAIFPLGNASKVQTRQIAEQFEFRNAQKKDSFDVCFVGGQKFREFMDKNYPDESGDIICYETNKIVGHHTGLSKFTVGQRKGLGVGGQKDVFGRWFVLKKDLKNNILYVSTDEDKLLASGLIAKKVNWISNTPTKDFNCVAKIRYRQSDQDVKVELLEDNKVRVLFKEKQRAIALGQFVVFYQGEICLGGAVIDEVIM